MYVSYFNISFSFYKERRHFNLLLSRLFVHPSTRTIQCDVMTEKVLCFTSHRLYNALLIMIMTK